MKKTSRDIHPRNIPTNFEKNPNIGCRVRGVDGRTDRPTAESQGGYPTGYPTGIPVKSGIFGRDPGLHDWDPSSHPTGMLK